MTAVLVEGTLTGKSSKEPADPLSVPEIRGGYRNAGTSYSESKDGVGLGPVIWVLAMTSLKMYSHQLDSTVQTQNGTVESTLKRINIELNGEPCSGYCLLALDNHFLEDRLREFVHIL